MKRLTEKYESPCTCCGGIRHCSTDCSYKQIYDRLAEYEYMEEQGLLLRLPCKVGDRVYQVVPDYTAPDKSLFIEEDVFHLGLLTDSGELPANCYFTLEEAEKALEEVCKNT